MRARYAVLGIWVVFGGLVVYATAATYIPYWRTGEFHDTDSPPLAYGGFVFLIFMLAIHGLAWINTRLEFGPPHANPAAKIDRWTGRRAIILALRLLIAASASAGMLFAAAAMRPEIAVVIFLAGLLSLATVKELMTPRKRKSRQP